MWRTELSSVWTQGQQVSQSDAEVGTKRLVLVCSSWFQNLQNDLTRDPIRDRNHVQHCLALLYVADPLLHNNDGVRIRARTHARTHSRTKPAPDRPTVGSDGDSRAGPACRTEPGRSVFCGTGTEAGPVREPRELRRAIVGPKTLNNNHHNRFKCVAEPTFGPKGNRRGSRLASCVCRISRRRSARGPRIPTNKCA